MQSSNRPPENDCDNFRPRDGWTDVDSDGTSTGARRTQTTATLRQLLDLALLITYAIGVAVSLHVPGASPFVSEFIEVLIFIALRKLTIVATRSASDKGEGPVQQHRTFNDSLVGISNRAAKKLTQLLLLVASCIVHAAADLATNLHVRFAVAVRHLHQLAAWLYRTLERWEH